MKPKLVLLNAYEKVFVVSSVLSLDRSQNHVISLQIDYEFVKVKQHHHPKSKSTHRNNGTKNMLNEGIITRNTSSFS